jgi:hypothetical protein
MPPPLSTPKKQPRRKGNKIHPLAQGPLRVIDEDDEDYTSDDYKVLPGDPCCRRVIT